MNDLFFDNNLIENLTKKDVFDLLTAAKKEWLLSVAILTGK